MFFTSRGREVCGRCRGGAVPSTGATRVMRSAPGSEAPRRREERSGRTARVQSESTLLHPPSLSRFNSHAECPALSTGAWSVRALSLLICCLW